MHFTSGRHLANYLLKIFKNNNIDISEDCIDSIKDLSKIFTYIENLPKDTKNILDLSNEYYNWITLSQNGKYQDLFSISNKSNENIAKFTNNPSIISFDEVFESFGLSISYNSQYLLKKPKQDDIYYPHHFKILEGTYKMARWNITFMINQQFLKEKILDVILSMMIMVSSFILVKVIFIFLIVLVSLREKEQMVTFQK